MSTRVKKTKLVIYFGNAPHRESRLRAAIETRESEKEGGC